MDRCPQKAYLHSVNGVWEFGPPVRESIGASTEEVKKLRLEVKDLAARLEAM